MTTICKVDTFDLAFLVLTGHVQLSTWGSLIAKAAQSYKDVVLWGPQAHLMGVVLKKGWRKHGAEITDEILDQFDLTGDISVDGKEARRLLRSKAFKESGIKTAEETREKIQEIIGMCQRKATLDFEQRETVGLEKQASIEAGWQGFQEKALANHVELFIQEFPGQEFSPRIASMIHMAEKNPKLRMIDKAALSSRIKNLRQAPERYLAGMGDVYAGRAWQGTVLSLAVSRQVTEYQVLAQNDRIVCPVCMRLDGRTFSVEQVHEKWQQYLNVAHDTDAIRRAMPFPRVAQLDNKDPKAVRAMGLMPPFHGRCRCDMVMLWGDVQQQTVEPIAPQTPLSVPIPKTPLPKPGTTKPRPSAYEVMGRGTIQSKEKLGGGVNTTEIVEVEWQGKRVKAVYKPVGGEAKDLRNNISTYTCPQGKREAMAYEVDKKLGINMVPETVFVDDITGGASMQRFVPNAIEGFDVASPEALRNNLKMKQTIFDCVVGNTDRHAGNWMVGRKSRKIHLIDNGLTFPETSDMNKFGTHNLRLQFEAYDLDENMLSGAKKKSIAKALDDTDWEEWGTKWGMPKREIVALQYRAKAVSKALQEDRFLDVMVDIKKGQNFEEWVQ